MIKAFGNYILMSDYDQTYVKAEKRRLNRDRSEHLRFLRGFIDFKIVSSQGIIRQTGIDLPRTAVGYKVKIDALGLKED